MGKVLIPVGDPLQFHVPLNASALWRLTGRVLVANDELFIVLGGASESSGTMIVNVRRVREDEDSGVPCHWSRIYGLPIDLNDLTASTPRPLSR
jgi:hypothetical protein